jgi:hypothetical protein
MVVEQPDGDPCWDYRRTAVERIHAAVRDLLLTSAGVLPHAIVPPNSDITSAHNSSRRNSVGQNRIIQVAQVFKVTYTDGTSSTFSQKLSDGFTPQLNQAFSALESSTTDPLR